ncbi:hypothetical protein VIGAN_07188700 [Vigna angularis var. angularis]|uniref:tRNA/rRNA methyltransferase SpoU type domain-containing protein n=1 Tax=Vigna angularis var. angularis TaxID=157739 RepID=A0A0S3SJI3_PHAAN|nr:uncharacterized protein LOC108333199 [Vigna angularis]BAT93004.1 hypothetical protein VIGAN_07188700 [Vigna angularis var. angularis]
MEITALKSLNIPTPFHFPSSKFSPFCQFTFFHFKPFLTSSSCRFSPHCSLNGSTKIVTKEGALPRGVGEAVSEASCSKFLQVVLVSPQIPGNTGCIARTCAASNVGLHLVGPLGFQVDDTKLKRAGLDYWPYVVVKVHDSWADFRDYFRQQEGEKRLLAFTKRGTQIHSEFSYRKGDYLLFGSETSGLPPEALLDCKTEPFGGGTIKIPMVETYVRCLNLSVSVGIALYEASRQLNYESLQVPSESHIDTTVEESFIAEDIFA